ncbi:MAG: hypothetical protein O7C75_04000 [Verrucomicrobia bacterium]|nr:hypothetical protein [Verrucomicrobiota bacterium]
MRSEKSIKATRKGFALVLTLVLLSFLLLLVVTLATSLRIETQTSFNNTQWNNARQNALMGMNIALGQLQELTGPDQRVTATGGIVSEKYSLPVGHEYWTGVWNSTSGNFEGWLVSDSIDSKSESIITQSTPLPNETGSSVWMVNNAVDSGLPDDDEKKVAIRKQPIRTTGIPGFAVNDRITTGNFAYWVSDEGVKASALKTDTPFPDSLSNLEKTRIQQLANRKTDLQELFVQFDEDDLETSRLMEYTFSFQQLEAIDGISKNGLARNFHELTPVSLGVLATTLDGSSGGLRQDLSQADRVSNGSIPINDAVLDFLDHRPDTGDFLQLRGTTGGGGEAQFSIPIVTTEFALRIGISLPETGDGPFKIHLALRADIWNPFSLPIKSTPRDTPDMQMQIVGLPTLTIEYRTTDGILRETYSINLQTSKIDEQDIDLFSDMAPGEVRNILEKYTSIETINFVDATPADEKDDEFLILGESSNLSVRLRTQDGRLLQEFANIPYSSFDTVLSRPLPRLSENEDYIESEMPLRFWFRFYDETDAIGGNSQSDLEGWSSDLDPRGSRLNFEDTRVSSLIEVYEDPYSGLITDDFGGRPEFFFGGNENEPGNNYHRFFDLPTVAPVSTGSLRHLMLPASGPNFLGNPNATLENRVFDEWYFSTIPKNQSDSQALIAATDGIFRRPFINPHIVLRGEPTVAQLSDPTEISVNTMLFGAFNINSTSVETWKLLLSGNSKENWEFRILYPGKTVKKRDVLDNPFFRLPFGADRHYKYPTDQFSGYPQTYNKNWFKTEWIPDWATSYTVGMREFIEEEIEELAEAIVEVIIEQQTPARSISDFLNKGILQEAINRTDINTINGASYRIASRANRIPLNAPAFLNQADVLNTIAPFIQARSDTFRIRAYGDAVNPVTGKIEGRAWCEAWVQRYPELVDDSKDIRDSADGLGRKFKIVHFKWLDESQI